MGWAAKVVVGRPGWVDASSLSHIGGGRPASVAICPSEGAFSFHVALLATPIAGYGGTRHHLDQVWLTRSQVALEPGRILHSWLLCRLSCGHIHSQVVLVGVVVLGAPGEPIYADVHG